MRKKFYTVLFLLLLPFLMQACGGSGGSDDEINSALNNALTDGPTLYANNCASCHGQLASSSKADRSALEIRNAINNVASMDNLEGLSATQLQAIADALLTTSGGNPNGATLYADNCAVCHGQLAGSSKAGSGASQIQAAIDGNSGGMGSLNLTATEVQAIADALVTTSGGNPNGATLYADNCAACHGQLAGSSKAGSGTSQIQAAIDGNTGGMGSLSLTPTEVQVIADALVTGADYSSCTTCHSQPPDGTVYPNTAGAHAAHRAIGSIGTDCTICHQNHAHNETVDLAFPAIYNAANSLATDNLDGTCGNISCHGGKTTPDWWSGAIDLAAQCTSCHSSGSAQYISYNSGRHSRHSGNSFSCTDCHNSSRMSSHIGNLATTTFEVSAASTIGGSGTSISSYSNGTCVGCHGSARW